MTFMKRYNFKFIYTGVTIRYKFDNTITMAEFIHNITHQAKIDFDIRNDLNMEIVEAGLNTDNRSAEMAPAIRPSNIPFKYFYINRNLDDLSFYIRIRTPNGTIMRGLENSRF